MVKVANTTKAQSKTDVKKLDERDEKMNTVDLNELKKQIVLAAKEVGAEIRETSAYTGVRINGRNAAEIHISKKQVTLVVSNEGVPKAYKALCHQVPPSFKWILDTKFIVTDAKKAQKACAIVQASVKYALGINNLTAKANLKALKKA